MKAETKTKQNKTKRIYVAFHFTERNTHQSDTYIRSHNTCLLHASQKLETKKWKNEAKQKNENVKKKDAQNMTYHKPGASSLYVI